MDVQRLSADMFYQQASNFDIYPACFGLLCPACFGLPCPACFGLLRPALACCGLLWPALACCGQPAFACVLQVVGQKLGLLFGLCREAHPSRPLAAAHLLLAPACAAPIASSLLQALRRFGQFRRIRLEQPLPIEQLVLAALEAQEVLGRWQVGGRLEAVGEGRRGSAHAAGVPHVNASAPVALELRCPHLLLPLAAAGLS